MKEAIENIASVKRLEYIRSPIYEIKGNSVTISKTSPPLGVIFIFNSRTKDFKIFQSWITSRTVSENERFDLSYILNSTFFYGFLDLDHKDEFTKGIYLRQDTVNIINNRIDNVENFKRFRDDLRYPLVKFEGNERIVDQALGFINFLSNIYDMLALIDSFVDTTLVSFVLSLFLTAATVILYHKSYKQALNSPVDQLVYYHLYPGLPSLYFGLPVPKLV